MTLEFGNAWIELVRNEGESHSLMKWDDKLELEKKLHSPLYLYCVLHIGICMIEVYSKKLFTVFASSQLFRTIGWMEK